MESAELSFALLIGGRSGVGKSTVALEVSHQLAEANVQHAVIEGDNLDLAYPEPWRHGLKMAEMNLAAMWRNYGVAGYRRLIYINTVSVLESKSLSQATGGVFRTIEVLLTSSDATARTRLAGREIGSTLADHIARSAQAAELLDARADDSVHRIATDDRNVADIARQVVEVTGWMNQ